MLSDGEIDNSLENTFKGVEDDFPKTLTALDNVQIDKYTILPDDIYNNLAWYCAFLHCLSPFAKAKAPCDFLNDLNSQLREGSGDLLDDYLKMPLDEKIALRAEIQNGKKIIFISENYSQLLHRVQFKRGCRQFFNYFRFHTKWVVATSKHEFPISDIALVEVPLENEVVYGLPISPNKLLLGMLPIPLNPPSTIINIVASAIPDAQAENWIDTICLTAQLTLASKQRMEDVIERRKRCESNGNRFHILKNPEVVLAAGTKDFSSDFYFKAVTPKEYKTIYDSYV